MINKKNILVWLCFFLNIHPENHTYTLITFLYNETNKNRLEEYKICIENNLNHPRINSIHILYDTSRDDDICELLSFLLSKNITITYIQSRPTYSYCFDIANKEYASKNIILSNADIYFNQTLDLLDTIDLKNSFIALTRWNIDEQGNLKLHRCAHSQDTWIFSTPITDFCDYPITMGIPTCDGRIAKQAMQTKLNVINPCLSVQCCHLHLTQLRNYGEIPFKWNDIASISWSKITAQSKKGKK